MAKKLSKDVIIGGGTEVQLDNFALFFLLIALFFLLIGIWGLVFLLFIATQTGVIITSAICVSLGAICMFQGALFYILLRAVAEVIRLLKKQNGLGFSGTISSPIKHRTVNCSKCGAAGPFYTNTCYNCKEEFIDDLAEKAT